MHGSLRLSMCLQAAHTDCAIPRLKLQRLTIVDCSRKKCSGNDGAKPFHDEGSVKRHAENGFGRANMRTNGKVEQFRAHGFKALSRSGTHRHNWSVVSVQECSLQERFDGMRDSVQA